MAGGLEGLTCGWCGKALTNCTIRREFCDRKCASRYHVAQNRAERIAARQGRKCLWCDGPIPAEARAGVIFCSKLCRSRCAADASKTRKTCDQCGKMFRGYGRFCTHACYGAHKRIRHPKTCPVCQKTFQPHRVEQVCCSWACAAPGKRALSDLSCGHCGKVFRPSRATVTFCCRSCARRARNGRNHG